MAVVIQVFSMLGRNTSWNIPPPWTSFLHNTWRLTMSFGKGALLWLIGIPLPIILLIALFWR